MKSIIRKILKEHRDEQAGQIIKDFMNETFDTYITPYYNWWDEIEIYVHQNMKILQYLFHFDFLIKNSTKNIRWICLPLENQYNLFFL